MDLHYKTKINELEKLKENNKIIRQLRQSKQKLLYEDPGTIAPFLKERYRNVFDTQISPRYYSPVESERQPIMPVLQQAFRNQYLEMMSYQRDFIQKEFLQIRLDEERNTHHLREHLDKYIREQDEKTTKNIDEIRNYLRVLNQNQMNINTQGNGSKSVLSDLKLLKNQYIRDGGTDYQIINDIDTLIEEAQESKEKLLNNFNWKDERRNMALAINKSNELRELERYNAEMEKQLEISRIRATNFNDKISPWNDEIEKKQLNQIEEFKNQIKTLQQEIDNLRRPGTRENQIMTQEDEERIDNPSISGNQHLESNLQNGNCTLMLDYISGISPHVASASLTLSIFNEYDEVIKPVEFKHACVRPLKKIDLDSSIPLYLKHPITNIPMSADTFVLLKLNTKTLTQRESKLECWARINLYDRNDTLREGKWENIFFVPPIQPYAYGDDFLQLQQCHHAIIHYQILNSVENEVSVNGNGLKLSNSTAIPITKNSKSENNFIVNQEIDQIDSYSENEKSDISVELKDRPELGFQIIRVKNLTVKDGLDFCKIHLTAYHTQGMKKGEILMSSTGAINCSTKSVKADFKLACFQFGKQMSSFTNVDFSNESIIIARFYMENDAEQLTSNRNGNSQHDKTLIAWTAIPLVKLKGGAKKTSNIAPDNLRLMRINKGVFDIPLYEPPVASPTHIVFGRRNIINGQKQFKRAKLKIRIFHTTPVFVSETSSDEISDNPNDEIENGYMKPWIEVERINPVLLPYHNDDGFDLYIDAGRLFPDTTGIVKIEGSIVNKNLVSRVPLFSAITSPSSDILNPVFNERIEIREPKLPPSSTILLKISMFDRVDKCVINFGYAALKVFVETGTNRQPDYDSLGFPISLNDGGHQIRVYSSGPSEGKLPFFESWFDKHGILPIPAATILLRMFKCQKDSTGKILNVRDVPQNKLKEMNLVIDPPTYESGYYYSMSCKPADGEENIMTQMSLRPKLLLKDLLASRWSDPLKDNIPYNDLFDKNKLIRIFDKAPPVVFNSSRIAHYNPVHGFKIAVDGCLNIPWTGYTMAHISICPPGALYQQKPLMSYDRPYLISHLDLNSKPSVPIWRNGWKTYRRRKYDQYLIAILHIQEMSLNVVQEDVIFSLENEAWIPIQIFDGLYCITKALQMPLIMGRPKLQDLEELRNKTVKEFLNDNLATKKITFLQNSSVVVRICDSRRFLEVSLTSQDQPLTLDQSYIPAANLTAYKSILKSKNETEFSKSLPNGFDADSFQELLKAKFKILVYKFYNGKGFILR